MFCKNTFLTVVGLLVTCQSLGQSPKIVSQGDLIVVVDSATQETVPEVLLIPLYSVARGAFVIPDGPGTVSKEKYHFGSPIVYRAGTKFPIKRDESFFGLPLLFAYIGRFTNFEGVLAVVPGYRPYFCKEYACLDFSPGFELTKVTNDEWTRLQDRELTPLVNKSSKKIEHCFMHGLQEKCNVEIKLDKKSRETARLFLQKHAPVGR